jgi:hypothetical protein
MTAVRSVGASLSSATRRSATRSRCSSFLSAAGSAAMIDRLPLLADAAVVIDAEVAADADQPGLEVGPPIERVERLVQFQEHVLGEIFGLVVPAHELVGDVEDLAPVQADDGLPRRLVTVQAAFDDLVGRIR